MIYILIKKIENIIINFEYIYLYRERMIKKRKINNNKCNDVNTFIFNMIEVNEANSIINKFNTNDNNLHIKNEKYNNDDKIEKKIENEIIRDVSE